MWKQSSRLYLHTRKPEGYKWPQMAFYASAYWGMEHSSTGQARRFLVTCGVTCSRFSWAPKGHPDPAKQTEFSSELWSEPWKAVVLSEDAISSTREMNSSSGAWKQNRDSAEEHSLAPLCLQHAEPYASTRYCPGLYPNTPSAGAPHLTVSAVLRALPALLPSAIFRDEVELLPAPEHCCPNRPPGWLPHSGHLWSRQFEMPLQTKSSRDQLYP